MEIRKEVRAFLISDPIYRGLLPAEFPDDFPLVESGALDSIGIFNLVNFLEKKFGIAIEPQELKRLCSRERNDQMASGTRGVGFKLA